MMIVKLAFFSLVFLSRQKTNVPTRDKFPYFRTLSVEMGDGNQSLGDDFIWRNFREIYAHAPFIKVFNFLKR